MIRRVSISTILVTPISLVASLALLLDVMLSTALLSLALSPHLIVVCLALLIASEASDGTTDGTLGTVGDTRAKVAKLALGLLLLALKVLLTAGLLEGLSSRPKLVFCACQMRRRSC